MEKLLLFETIVFFIYFLMIKIGQEREIFPFLNGEQNVLVHSYASIVSFICLSCFEWSFNFAPLSLSFIQFRSLCFFAFFYQFRLLMMMVWNCSLLFLLINFFEIFCCYKRKVLILMHCTFNLRIGKFLIP